LKSKNKTIVGIVMNNEQTSNAQRQFNCFQSMCNAEL